MTTYEIAFSRRIPAGWPPLHAAETGANETLCGIALTSEWDYDSLTIYQVECKRCRAKLVDANAFTSEGIGHELETRIKRTKRFLANAQNSKSPFRFGLVKLLKESLRELELERKQSDDSHS